MLGKISDASPQSLSRNRSINQQSHMSLQKNNIRHKTYKCYKRCEYVKPSTMTGKTEYKWKTT